MQQYWTHDTKTKIQTKYIYIWLKIENGFLDRIIDEVENLIMFDILKILVAILLLIRKLKFWHHTY